MKQWAAKVYNIYFQAVQINLLNWLEVETNAKCRKAYRKHLQAVISA